MAQAVNDTQALEAIDQELPFDATQDVEDVAEDGLPTADAVPDVSMAADVTAQDCQLVASHETLVPPPVTVEVKPVCTGKPPPGSCAWSAGPATVCELAGPGKVRKVGDGVCTVQCALPGLVLQPVTLVAKKQTVIYLVGGFAEDPSKNAGLVQRYRTADKQWDLAVTEMPELRHNPSVGHWAGKLFVLGGSVYPEASYPYGKKCFEVIALGLYACPAIWAFDLTTNAWSMVGEIDPIISEASTVQRGSYLYVVGGFMETAPKQDSVIFRFDMATGKMDSLQVPDPPNYAGILSAVAWGKDGLIVFNGSDIYTWYPGDVKLNPVDLGYPCKSSPSTARVMNLPAAEPNLFVNNHDYPPLPGGSCPQLKKSLDPPYPLQFQRYLGGKWSEFKTLVLPNSYVYLHASTNHGLYVFPTEEVLPGTTPAPVFRLASVDGAWEPLAPMPYWRSGFATIAVEQ